MASKKKAKKGPAKKAKKKVAKKAKASAKKKVAAKAKKAVKKKAAKKAKAPVKKKAVKAVKAKKAAAKQPVLGEGNYAAARAFDRDEARFVKKNKARIPAMGKAAEAALDGPEGASLRAAEVAARSHSKAGPSEAAIAAAEAEGLKRDAN